MEQCDTAQENPIFRSRFTTQVKTKDIPAPIRLPEVPRYTTQVRFLQMNIRKRPRPINIAPQAAA